MGEYYEIIKSDFTGGLEEIADKLIKKGWEPQGGPFQRLDQVCQAMYRKPEKKKKEPKR